MNKKVTIWRRLNLKTNQYGLNHIEDGHVKENKPTPKSEEQVRSWELAVWKKQFGILDGVKVKIK